MADFATKTGTGGTPVPNTYDSTPSLTDRVPITGGRETAIQDIIGLELLADTGAMTSVSGLNAVDTRTVRSMAEFATDFATDDTAMDTLFIQMQNREVEAPVEITATDVAHYQIIDTSGVAAKITPAISMDAMLAAPGVPAAIGDTATFLPSGTGAVRRTYSNRAEFVSLKDFNAIGDNVTNDKVAFENFCAEVESSGKPGYIPPGTYLIYNGSKTFNLAKPLRLFGDGSLKSRLYLYQYPLIVDGGSNRYSINLNNFSITHRTSSVDGLVVKNTNRSLLSGMVFSGFTGRGLYIVSDIAGDMDFLDIIASNIFGCGTGIEIDSTLNGANLVSVNILGGSITQSTGKDLLIKRSSTGIVSRISCNQLWVQANGAGNGIHMEDAVSFVTLYDVFVDGNGSAAGITIGSSVTNTKLIGATVDGTIDDSSATTEYVSVRSSGATYSVMRPNITTSAILDSISSAINTKQIFAGKPAWNSTTSKPVWKVGATAGSVWIDGAGTIVHTPV